MILSYNLLFILVHLKCTSKKKKKQLGRYRNAVNGENIRNIGCPIKSLENAIKNKILG